MSVAGQVMKGTCREQKNPAGGTQREDVHRLFGSFGLIQ